MTFRLIQYFIPLQNPLGFSLLDFLTLGLAFFIAAALIAHRATRFPQSPRIAIGILFALPLLLRISLLSRHPIPIPTVSDDFSYLLLGDTLAHFRLANPLHPMRRFFETVFVLQDPSYSSIFPLGQGIALAFGQLLFRTPWIGILFTSCAIPPAVYWMLRAWVTPAWAFIGGLLAIMQFGPLNQWMNNYWGGALTCIAGCLAFGAMGRNSNGALMGAGLGLQILTRPFEALLMLFALGRRRPRLAFALALAPALILTAAHNHAVTGSVFKLPYMLSRAQYGIPTTFTFQQLPAPQRQLTQEQDLDYRAQSSVHGTQPESLFNYLARLLNRAKFLRFFLLPPLYLAILFALPALRDPRYRQPAIAIAIFLLGTTFYPYFYPHYIAAIACLFLLFAINGLMRMPLYIAKLLLLLCGAQFLLWYGIHLLGNEDIYTATRDFESWDYINYGDYEHRAQFESQLRAQPGDQLVFVHLSTQHLLREWIYNDADIDRARIVRALDLGPEENKALLRYYPKRKAWLLEPDNRPPTLLPYPTQ